MIKMSLKLIVCIDSNISAGAIARIRDELDEVEGIEVLNIEGNAIGRKR